ncbi:MAG: Uncharacterised protein [Methanobacteriota archaeon]|nr:MAG: Uncharacterised protein [Euryarchaeota archaeon]|tara:strand:- start:1717 stop:2664 length:948 start_codon:yes stop_codon:yes gene_type:complete
MAETMVTLAFLSGIAMMGSAFYKNGKWFSLLPLPFICIELINTRFSAIHDIGGSVLWICLALCLTSAIFLLYLEIPYKLTNAVTGLVTTLLLLAYFPEQGIGETIQTYSSSENLQALLLQLFFGVGLGFSIYNIQKIPSQWYILLPYPLLLIGILYNISLLDSLLDSPITNTLLILPLLAFADDRIDKKLGGGKGRSVALSVSIIIGIILMFTLTWIQVSQIERIGDGYGAISVTMWMLVATVSLGLAGMLLPLIGFDAKARPESWGWRMGLALSPMLLTLITDLSPYLMIGIWCAITISITAPLVLERDSKKVL